MKNQEDAFYDPRVGVELAIRIASAPGSEALAGHLQMTEALRAVGSATGQSRVGIQVILDRISNELGPIDVPAGKEDEITTAVVTQIRRLLDPDPYQNVQMHSDFM